jgi:peptide alpha-N-acetyltransferase
MNKSFRNYAQAMRCYVQALKNDPENYNVVRDLSYLQLYLRQYNSFLETAKKGIDLRSNALVNWTTYAFANYLVINK